MNSNSEPTYRQHRLLERLQKAGGTILKTGEEPNISIYRELAKAGYLSQIVTPFTEFRYNITNQTIKYMRSINE